MEWHRASVHGHCQYNGSHSVPWQLWGHAHNESCMETWCLSACPWLRCLQGLFATIPWKMRNCEVLEWPVMRKPLATSEEFSTVTVDVCTEGWSESSCSVDFTRGPWLQNLPQPKLMDGWPTNDDVQTGCNACTQYRYSRMTSAVGVCRLSTLLVSPFQSVCCSLQIQNQLWWANLHDSSLQGGFSTGHQQLLRELFWAFVATSGHLD